MHRSWVYALKARYETEGPDAFEPRSRGPGISPGALAPGTLELILQLRRRLDTAGLDAGPETVSPQV
ncbi:MAG: hypothetical protein ABJA93_12165 [Sporichthyaceae bacterium]